MQRRRQSEADPRSPGSVSGPLLGNPQSSRVLRSRVQALFSYIHCHLFTLSGVTYASICRLADPQQSYESSTPT